MGMVDVVLVNQPMCGFDHVPVMMPCSRVSAVPLAGENVVLGFLNGDLDHPVVIGLLDRTTREECLRTALPYSDGTKLENRVLVVYPHETDGNEEEEHLRRASWLAVDDSGLVRFVHNQRYPATGSGAAAPEYARKYLVLEIDEAEALGLRFPWTAGASERTLHAQADDKDGDLKLVFDRTGGADLTLAVTRDQTIKLQVPNAGKTSAKTVEIKCDGAAVAVAVGESRISIGATIRITASGVTFELDNGKVTLAAQRVDIDSGDIRLGDGGRQVAFKGARVKQHRHSVTVDGRRLETSYEESEIDEGAPEVKV